MISASRAAVLLLMLGPCLAQELVPDEPIDCRHCEMWNQPQAPFHVFGNTWYVGTAKIAVVLIDTGDGIVLLDGALPQSVPLIEANIRELGFDARDIRVIGVSHEHYDHVGGIAALQRLSGARVLAGPAALKSLRSGQVAKDDPQYGRVVPFPPIENVSGVGDGETIRIGSVDVRAIHTPGHTPGGTSWTWQSCEGERCLDIVYVDSLSAASGPGYRYSEGMDASVRKTVEIVTGLDCDIMLSTHDTTFDLHEKLPQGREAFVNSGACRHYAGWALRRLEKRLEEER